MLKPWSEADDAYLRKHYKAMSDQALAAALGRTRRAVINRRCRLSLSREPGTTRTPWSADEIEYLTEHWGSIPVPRLASRLHRTPAAVKCYANRLGLAQQLGQGDMMSLETVMNMLGIKNDRILHDWEAQGLRITYCSVKQSVRMQKAHDYHPHCIIRMDDLLSFLKTHPDCYDSRRIALYGLGVEYPWLQEKRQQDAQRPPLPRWWTDQERSRLAMMVRRNMSRKDIARELQRSVESVRSQIDFLKLTKKKRRKKKKPSKPSSQPAFSPPNASKS